MYKNTPAIPRAFWIEAQGVFDHHFRMMHTPNETWRSGKSAYSLLERRQLWLCCVELFFFKHGCRKMFSVVPLRLYWLYITLQLMKVNAVWVTACSEKQTRCREKGELYEQAGGELTALTIWPIKTTQSPSHPNKCLQSDYSVSVCTANMQVSNCVNPFIDVSHSTETMQSYRTLFVHCRLDGHLDNHNLYVIFGVNNKQT